MFRHITAVAVLLAASVGSVAQSAKVEAISAEDTVKIKALYAEKAALDKQMAAVEKKISDFNEGIKARYLTTKEPDKGWCSASFSTASGYVWIKNGWACGAFQYSDDFRFVVPAASIPVVNCCPTWSWASNLSISSCSVCGVTGTFTTSPAIGGLPNQATVIGDPINDVH